METRRSNKRVRVASSDQASSLGVHAPSVVQTQSKSANQAATLGAALGLGQQIGAEQVQIKQTKDAEAGALGAMNAEFTDEELHTMEKSAAYVMGAQKVFAKQRIIEDAAAANDWYQTEFDKDAGLDDLRAGLNDFWSARYEGVSTGMAREITPLMAQTSDNLMESHANFQANATHTRLIEAQGQVLGQALKGGNYDWNALRTEGNSVLGKDKMNEVAVDAISNEALRTQDETIWERPEFAMLRKNKQFKDEIEKNISDARTMRHKANEAATINEQGDLLAQMDILAETGDTRFPARMAAATQLDQNGIQLYESEAAAKAAWAKYYDALSKPANATVNTSLWGAANGRAIEKDSDRDDAAMQDATDKVESIRRANPDMSEEEVALAGRTYLIERSEKNNYLPKPLKAELEISPTHPRFPDAVALYDQFEAQRADWVGTQIDPNTVRDFKAYKRHLRENGGDQQAAMESVGIRDSALYTVLSVEEKAAAHNQVVDVLTDGFMFGDNDINDSPRLRSIIKEDFRYYVEQGMPYEMAIEESISNLQGRYSVVDGELYDVNDGWGADAQDAADMAKELIAIEHDQTGWFSDSPDISDVSIIPVPNRPGYVRIALSGPLQSLGSMTEVPISEIMTVYSTAAEAAAIRIAEDSESETDQEVIRKAKADFMPIPASVDDDNHAVYMQMVKERDRRWNELTQAQRGAHMVRQRN